MDEDLERIVGALRKVIEAVRDSTGMAPERVATGSAMPDHHKRMLNELQEARKLLDEIG